MTHQVNSPRKPKSLRAETVTPPQALSRSSIAMGISAAMLMPLAAMAQNAPTTTLSTVTVQEKAIDPNPNAEVGAPYKAKTSADTRYTRPLAEIPQTISVITKAAIDDSGFTDLKQILAAQPGITLGTGENGNAFGDRYIIRGQEAKSDVFVDGLRDPGMTTRESFAIEQLEITKGPNSTFAGRGSAGGAINAITKQATLDYDFTRFSGALGSDSHKRITGDANKALSDKFAVRINALWGEEGVPDRSPSERKREGLALSGLYEINTDLSLTLDYYGMRAKDKAPDLGSFLVGTVPNRVPASGVPVYAQSADFLGSDVDTVTARVKYKLAPDMSLTSLTRYGKSSNAYATTGASSGTRYNGTSTVPYTAGALDGGHTGWQDVDYFAHQTNLRWDKLIAGFKHEFIFGVEYTDHQVVSGSYAATNSGAFNCRTPTAASPALTGALNQRCITDANGNPVANLSDLAGRQYARQGWSRDWQVKTLSASVMDTVDISDKWTLFGGLRADNYDLKMALRTPATGIITNNYAYGDTLFNGHFGASYKINPQGMIYASVATAQDINGGEPDSGTSSGYGGLVIFQGSPAGAKPETSKNIELGTKWNLLDDKLLATAAVFQSTKSDVMEGADYLTAGTFNTGRNRVRGVEFGLAGNITPQFTVQAGVAFLKSKVLNAFAAANVGKPLSNFADRTFSVQGKYQITPAFSIGAAARHESDRCGGQPDTAAGFTATGLCSQPVPSFTVYDMFGSYRLNKHADVRVNVLNVTNKDYYTAVYRSGSFLYKGDSRAVRVTLNYEL